MKNLLIYISPTGSFNNPRSDLTSNDAGQLVKVQIENSLSLGWKMQDILLYTNFKFQYGDFTSALLNDVEFFERKPQASKINAIIKLFDEGLIENGQLYWFHDFDAFQLQPIPQEEISIPNDCIALTDYGGIKFLGQDRWSTGVIYFKSGSSDIFKRIKEIMYENQIDEEEALGLLTARDPEVRNRVLKINNSYNFIGYYLKSCYQNAIKPLKVAHFHPLAGNRRLGTENSLRFFMGENKLKIPLITENLVKIFKYHRIRQDGIGLDRKNVAIFIPTLKRAHKILSIYKNAKESSPLISEVYFIVEKDDWDSLAVLKSNRLKYFINERTKSSAGALNTAYLNTKEKYFFIGADDLDFKPGWLEKCLKLMTGPIKVVGTNDLHNREVLRGVYATHFLVARDYIQTRSGIFDEENLLLSESYFHNWGEREFIETAKLRGVFSPCLESHVEHLHWGWGLAEKDSTYTKQDGTSKRDLRNYLKRKELWTEKLKSEIGP